MSRDMLRGKDAHFAATGQPMRSLDPAELAWAAAGAPFPLAETPKPDDITAASKEIAVADERNTDAGLTVGQVRDHLAALARISRDATMWHGFETWHEIADAIDTAAGDLQHDLEHAGDS